MQIGGLQKLSLLDYPDHTCCTLFTIGCNYRCPYCHNASLVVNTDATPRIAAEEVLAFLQRRQGLLDGVCVTGGEPLLQPDLAEFLAQIKQLGFDVKLDTNGSMPKELAGLLGQGLVDYVAMDVKSAPGGYAAAVGLAGYDTDKIQQSIKLLRKGTVPYEFRTTVVRQLHSEAEMEALASWLKGAPRYFLQAFEASENTLQPGMSGYSRAEMEQLLAVVHRQVPAAQLRGV